MKTVVRTRREEGKIEGTDGPRPSPDGDPPAEEKEAIRGWEGQAKRKVVLVP